MDSLCAEFGSKLFCVDRGEESAVKGLVVVMRVGVFACCDDADDVSHLHGIVLGIVADIINIIVVAVDFTKLFIFCYIFYVIQLQQQFGQYDKVVSSIL